MERETATPLGPVLSTVVSRARARIASEQQKPDSARTEHGASIPERA